LAESS